MASNELGNVIAERQLELVNGDGVTTDCFVRVGNPVPDGNEDWLCPYEVEAGSHVQRFRMHGIDSMQALILTLKTLDGEIFEMAKKLDATVRYLDGNHASVFNP